MGIMKGNLNKENTPDCLFWYWDESKHLEKERKQSKRSSQNLSFQKLGNANNKKRLELKTKCLNGIENSLHLQ